MKIASQIPEKEIINLKNIFKLIDVNGNGLISLDEMIAGMKEFEKLGVSNLGPKDAKRLFDAIDCNHSGEIDYTEFIAACMYT